MPVQLGSTLNARQLKALQANSPTADDILGQEIEEDPEAELDRINQEASAVIAQKQEQAKQEKEAQETKQEQTPEDSITSQILGALRNHPKAPSEAQIAKWKQEYGKNAVYVIALNEDDVYVFTYLRRGGFKKIQETIANAQQAGMVQNGDDMLKEKVLGMTVLFPKLSVEFYHNSRAGTVPTLFDVIMAHSSFLQLSQAMVLTTQL